MPHLETVVDVWRSDIATRCRGMSTRCACLGRQSKYLRVLEPSVWQVSEAEESNPSPIHDPFVNPSFRTQSQRMDTIDSILRDVLPSRPLRSFDYDIYRARPARRVALAAGDLPQNLVHDDVHPLGKLKLL